MQQLEKLKLQLDSEYTVTEKIFKTLSASLTSLYTSEFAHGSYLD